MFLTGNFSTTVGIDYKNKVVTLGEETVHLQIFDTVSLIIILRRISRPSK
jgi:hypothetical protein